MFITFLLQLLCLCVDLKTLTLHLQWINNDINISQISTCSGMYHDTLVLSHNNSDWYYDQLITLDQSKLPCLICYFYSETNFTFNLSK